jgi:UDP-glucose 4-epimerase
MDNLSIFKNKTILITGGTGSFGNRILKRLSSFGAKEIRVYSRDEKKQYDMKLAYKDLKNVNYLVGDIRDSKRLRQALEGVDIVYQAAALKQVPSCERCPEEAIKTNIIGVMNLIDCAIDAKVKKVIAISTDKSVKPVNTMGMTKALQEKVIIAANDLPNNKDTIFSCVRYGNVMCSRGSAIPFFRDLIKFRKTITITHPEMTRFMLTLDDAIDLVFFATEHMEGGEIFVKKAPSIKIVDLARILYKEHNGSDKNFKFEVIGMYPGEKIHEILISEEEKVRSTDKGDFFVIKKFEKNEPFKDKSYEEYCSKNVITNEEEILKLLKKADLAASEDYYKNSLFIK